MRTTLEQLAPEVDDAILAEARKTRLEQQRNERCEHGRGAALLVLGVVLFIAGVLASCGVGGDTTLEAGGNTGPDIDNRDGGGYSDSGERSQRETDDPPGDSGPVKLVRVPDVIGLSSDEATSRLDTAGFDVGYGLKDVPEPGVDHDTVTGAYPGPGTLVPFGSPIWLEVYIDNQLDTSSPIDTDRGGELTLIITREIEAEFGDRAAWDYWDETTETYNIRIVDLAADEARHLQSRYDNEDFAVNVSSVPIGYPELRTLIDSTLDQLNILKVCAAPGSRWRSGVEVVTWSVLVAYFLMPVEGQSIDDCESKMKQAVLANAADFAKEHSILVDPTDLVRFEIHPPDPPGSGTDELVDWTWR